LVSFLYRAGTALTAQLRFELAGTIPLVFEPSVMDKR
jgi:hypothetical protein